MLERAARIACAVRYTFREGLILRVDGAMDPDRDRALDALRS